MTKSRLLQQIKNDSPKPTKDFQHANHYNYLTKEPRNKQYKAHKNKIYFVN